MNRVRFWWRYVRHNTPWDTQIVPPEIVTLTGKLPPSRALDIGCGTGTTSLYLAANGWTVVGVDFIPSAIRLAKHKAHRANLPLRFYVADASKLAFLSESFDFAIDIGCLHSLTAAAQQGYSEHLARLTGAGAVYALYAFMPRWVNGIQSGLSAENISTLFAPSFIIESSTLGKDKGNGPVAGWYYLRRV